MSSPDETKEFDVTYPEEYAQESLSGKTVRFQLTPKFVRKKELPALDDEFARDLGDFQTLEELKDAVRKSIFNEKQYVAQQAAKEELVDRVVASHEFPVPEAYIDRQIENQVRMQLQRSCRARCRSQEPQARLGQGERISSRQGAAERKSLVTARKDCRSGRNRRDQRRGRSRNAAHRPPGA